MIRWRLSRLGAENRDIRTRSKDETRLESKKSPRRGVSPGQAFIVSTVAGVLLLSRLQTPGSGVLLSLVRHFRVVNIENTEARHCTQVWQRIVADGGAAEVQFSQSQPRQRRQSWPGHSGVCERKKLKLAQPFKIYQPFSRDRCAVEVESCELLELEQMHQPVVGDRGIGKAKFLELIQGGEQLTQAQVRDERVADVQPSQLRQFLQIEQAVVGDECVRDLELVELRDARRLDARPCRRNSRRRS